ncbi:MAG: spore germination protein, partial [Oscillospiraceae bacterium]|nr:spore germination protein [Oscillospiraceae bacterium]
MVFDITGILKEDTGRLEKMLSGTADLMNKKLMIGDVQLSFIMIEGMVSLSLLAQMISRPLLGHDFGEHPEPEKIRDFILEQTVMAADQKQVKTLDEAVKLAMSGFVVIFIDGAAQAIALGAQGFSFRSVGEPEGEVNERGSREGFTEPLKINMSLIRRRVKSGALKFESFQVGEKSRTDGCLVYMTDAVSPVLLEDVRRRLSKVKLPHVLDTGYLQPFLEGDTLSPFSEVGVTERPDTLCARIAEGRVAVLLDGTPYALIVPNLFTEHFQSFDDYAHRPYFTAFVRSLKFASFLLTIFLPGVYVALATFHPESLPHLLLRGIISAEMTTPFPLMLEALLIHFIYEIMREAGLRLPRPIGHAVSIVGALVVGDAAVT